MSSFSRHKAYEQVRPHHHVFILLHLYKEHKKEKVTAPHLYKASISLLWLVKKLCAELPTVHTD
jgi:hypothetical protein